MLACLPRKTTSFRHAYQDAQWAGVANALPELRGQLRMADINKYADSFSTNLHKWGLVGFDCCKSGLCALALTLI